MKQKSISQEIATNNYSQLQRLLPITGTIGTVMTALSIMVDDLLIVTALLGALTIFSFTYYFVMKTFHPSEDGFSAMHIWMTSSGLTFYLLWGASMLGYKPNSYVSYFDFTIAVVVCGLICQLQGRKLLTLYALALCYLFFFTPLFVLLDDNYVVVAISLVLFCLLAAYCGDILYRKTVENHRLTHRLLEQQVNLEHRVQKQARALQTAEDRMSHEVVRALSKLIEFYDPYTRGHSENVATLAETLARSFGLGVSQQKDLFWAGVLHDIGKVEIPKDILNKKEPLSTAELEMIKMHPVVGHKMLQESDTLKRISGIVLHHHERFDGSGYPSGLQGSEIPLESRILALADAWDAMRSQRVYRAGLSTEDATVEVINNRGTQFDPQVVDLFLSLKEIT